MRGWLIALVVVLVVLLLSLRGLARFYTDYLWFQEVGFTDTWRSLLGARLVPAAVFTVVFFAVLLASLVIGDRLAPVPRALGPEDEMIERYRQYAGPYQGRIRVGVAAFFAIVAGAGVAGQWEEWVLFRNRVDFGIQDPQFGRDVGFYVFTLPFLRFVVDWVFAGLVIILIVTAVAHYLNGGIRLQSPFQRVTPQVKAHLSVILAAMALTRAFGYWLAQFQLNFSGRGVVDGASATDVDVQLKALQLLVVISIAAAALFVVNIRRRGWALPVIAVGLWAFVSLVAGTIVPTVYQNVSVDPNEFSKESRYIERNIEATRQAFGLDVVDVQPFDYSQTLSAADLAEGTVNAASIANARLWDPDVLRSAYAEQEFRPFYTFNDVDADRYRINGNVQPVMIGVRELDSSSLPSNTWTNRHLVYTHGYAAVVSDANRSDDASPAFLLSNIPATTSGEAPSLQVDQPSIYYGEGLGGFVLVDSETAEFTPRTTEEAGTTRYEGSGGITMSNFVRRAAVALRFGDVNALISGQVTSRTKVLFERDVRSRVEKAAPFLRFDSDPYAVVLDGRILWVIDGYTTTGRYPYSQGTRVDDLPAGSGLDGELNYVRNSVKATVDAYDGTVTYYVWDEVDPVLRAYRKAFPELFTDRDDMPDGLVDHLRYPEDLFRVQTEVFARYHVTDLRTFYDGSDLWATSPDPSTGRLSPEEIQPATTTTQASGERDDTLRVSGERIDPLYLTMALPGSDTQQFLLQRPFVPINRNNQLSALMVAGNDGDQYGKLFVYTMPDDRQVPSPVNVNNQLLSSPDVSGQFTVLNQQGSIVIQGSLQVIPVGDTILYVRPVYVQGRGTNALPELRFVAVVYGNQTGFGSNLAQALADLGLAGGAPGPTPPPAPPGGETSDDVARLLAQAQAAFTRADEALRAGNLAGYQAAVREAQSLVARALELAATPSAAPAPTSTTTSTQRTA